MQSFDNTNKSFLVNSNGEKYIDFRNKLSPNYLLVWTDIGFGYLMLASVLALGIYLHKQEKTLVWIFVLPASVWIGYWIAYLNLFMHEASHFNVARSKKANDILANLLLGLFIGNDILFYRTMHYQHHNNLGTTQDTEKSYFDGLSVRMITETLTGIRTLKVFRFRNRNMVKNQGLQLGKQIVFRNNVIMGITSLLHIFLVATLILSNNFFVALAWIIGVGIMFPFFAIFRQILEHRTLEAKAEIDYSAVNQGASHRMFGEGVIASTMGAAGFNRHLIHHWDASISYTRFKDVEVFLMNTPLRDNLNASRTTYLKTFLLLFNHRLI